MPILSDKSAAIYDHPSGGTRSHSWLSFAQPGALTGHCAPDQLPRRDFHAGAKANDPSADFFLSDRR